MRDSGQKKSLGDLNHLLCTSTLKISLRSTPDPHLPAREGLKELLNSHKGENTVAGGALLPSAPEPEFSRWEHGLDLLVEEFLTRKAELTRLNRARKEQIEAFLRLHSKMEITLEQALQGRLGSPEQEALQLFAHQAAVFYLLQILLVKRWVDRGLLEVNSLKPTGHTLNWQITTYLKRNSRQGMMGRHDWSFLKQNLFSWYAPLPDTSERIRLLLEPVSLAEEASNFPTRLLRSLGARSRLSLLGFSPTLIDSSSLWQLLLEQKAADERLESFNELDFASGTGGPILVSGLGNGESLSSLRELSKKRELHGVWAYTDSEFERFLSEMFILWDCAAEIPRINLHSRSALKDLNRADKRASLFGEAMGLPHQAQFAACFQDPGGKELEDVSLLLAPLKENGLLLVASDQFWPTDISERSEQIRDQALKHSSVRLIIDLRQLTGTAGERLPKGIAILEKCSSKEIRDSNRPQLLRARGHLQSHQVQAFWSAVLEQVRIDSNPGEVSVKTLVTVGEGVKLESMAAAANQLQLRASPWLTLSDPVFYEASSRLRRSLHKAHILGTVLRWRPGMPFPAKRGVLLQEQGKSLVASLPSEAAASDKEELQYLFLPDNSVAEHPLFFRAQVFSAPVQFWFRLESEQSPAKRSRGNDRQNEKRIMLMPLLRLFEPSTLFPTPNPKQGRPCASIEEARRELTAIFRQGSRGMAENGRLHEIILSLENSIEQNVEVCREFTRHLFPELEIRRWDLPASLPEVAPRKALEILRHLNASPLAHHPAIQVIKMRSAQDFKVTNCVLEELPLGEHADLKVFHGIDLALKLSGPSILLKAAQEEIQKRLGRPWRETSERISFPTDVRLFQTQLQEVVRSAEQQLATTREYAFVMDQIFCCLFGLSTSFTDEKVRQAIRHHLSPEDSRIALPLPKELISIKPRGFESPIGILQ